MTSAAPAPQIAYLTGEYPTVSHTFILREVEALRAAGLEVETCSIRQTGVEHHRGPAEQDAAKTTFYVLRAAKNPRTFLRAQARALRQPGRYFAALAKAWRMRAPGWRAACYQLFYFAEATVLAQHLQAQGITQLHNHFAGPSATVALLAAQMLEIDFSFTLHGPADLAEPKYWRLDEKIAAARFVSCISHFARSQCMLHTDSVHWHKLHVIHCGVTPALYAAPPASKNDDAPQLIFVGRLAAVKGLRVLIEAMAEALPQLPTLHLTLVGDGPDRSALEAAAAPLGAAVTFTGYLSQQQVAETLAEADMLVLPSFAEGVPVVLMEAMASGKPVIATRVAGVSELVEHGVNGLLVAPGDAQGLGHAIAQLASDRAQRQRMGEAGQKTVTAEFDIALEAARLATLFRAAETAAVRPALPD